MLQADRKTGIPAFRVRPAGLACAGSLNGMTRKRRAAPVWIPLDVSAQDGRKVTLTGSAAVKLSEKITTPRALEIKDRNRRIMGRIRTIDNDHGRLTAVFHQNVLEEPVPVSGRFLLGLTHRGRHTTIALYQVQTAPAAAPSGYVGMLGEDL